MRRTVRDAHDPRTGSVGKAAGRIAEAERAPLSEELTAMRDTRDFRSRGSRQTFLGHDAHFHDHIAAACGSTLMRRMLDRLHARAHLYRLHSREDMATETCQEHARILEALAAEDPDIAASAMRSHNRRARARPTSALGADPAGPSGSC
ncbi:FCD domain-containing protein [Streptomyces sp. NBC_00347]|uniref:FCD domain-containing protein n=1 Tax=Streptomyces sp. NBC_00347 TaxID=2975721 RepID=UPI002256DE76|nr:FCD domain-containing protein [Streptomyces sp. NBC_00347]MCX5126794.1 FCD domain-containing protein [Streptomyces sp. NBC_00347]